jgi:hypothetical protein
MNQEAETMGIRRVVIPNKAEKLIDGMYAGRQYGKKMDASYGSIPVPTWELDPKNNSAAIQNREDQRDVSYDNTVKKNWLRGYGDCPHPQFDHSKKGR